MAINKGQNGLCKLILGVDEAHCKIRAGIINMRRIGRQLSGHHRTASLWFEAHAASLSEVPQPEEVKAAEVGEFSTLSATNYLL
jgi:hypothetical protein